MKPRRLLRVRSSSLARVGHLLLAVLALALVWYGSMVILLALGLAPRTVDAISGYRTILDYFAGLPASAITARVRLIAGLAGAATFAAAAWLAWKGLPRPYGRRADLVLEAQAGGAVVVLPRAIERAAESAALEQPSVTESVGSYEGDHLDVGVALSRTSDVATTLREVQRRVVGALAIHELPPLPVSVTLTGFRQPPRRELN